MIWPVDGVKYRVRLSVCIGGLISRPVVVVDLGLYKLLLVNLMDVGTPMATSY